MHRPVHRDYPVLPEGHSSRALLSLEFHRRRLRLPVSYMRGLPRRQDQKTRLLREERTPHTRAVIQRLRKLVSHQQIESVSECEVTGPTLSASRVSDHHQQQSDPMRDPPPGVARRPSTDCQYPSLPSSALHKGCTCVWRIHHVVCG